MEELNINSVNDYKTLKQALGFELSRAAISFCRIGYLLKRARDEEGILQESGYKDVNEFAEKEFGLDKSQVSRFMRINDRFSVGGYSEHLKQEYEHYGSAKLSLMLLLPEAITEEITPDYSKSEIETIVKDYKEEKAITDLEVMCEDTEDVPDEFIAAVVKELNDEHPDPARELHEEYRDNTELIEPDDAKSFYMPEDARTFNIRITGQGRFMVNMKEENITVINMRRPEEKSPVSWEEFTAAVKADLKTRIFPKKEEKKAEPKNVTRQQKPPKVEPAKPKKKEVAPVQQPEKVKYEKPEIIEEPVSKTKEGDCKNEEPHETGVSETKNEEKPESTTWSGSEENEKASEPETDDLSLDNPENDRYEYMAPDETINALEEMLGDYEQEVIKKNTTFVYVAITLVDAGALYNAVQELKYMKKLGGSRR